MKGRILRIAVILEDERPGHQQDNQLKYLHTKDCLGGRVRRL